MVKERVMRMMMRIWARDWKNKLLLEFSSVAVWFFFFGKVNKRISIDEAILEFCLLQMPSKSALVEDTESGTAILCA